MLMTVTNATNHQINYPDEYYGYPGMPPVNAVGGNVVYPIPYPFGHVGPMNPQQAIQLPVHPRDWSYKASWGIPMLPSEDWNTAVQSGLVTLAFATEVGNRDQEEIFDHLI